MAPNPEEATALSIAFSSFFTAFTIFFGVDFLFSQKRNPDDSLFTYIFIFSIFGYIGHPNIYDAIIFAGCSTLGAYSGVWLNLKIQLAKDAIEKDKDKDKPDDKEDK